MASDDGRCDVCGEVWSFLWTDTHGIGACIRCNTPYRIYHYEEINGVNQRIERGPTLLVLEEWVPFTKRYWEEKHLRIPHSFNFQGSNYEVCSAEEFESWNDWCRAHESEVPR